MSNMLMVLQQVIVMFLLSACGYVMFRFGKISLEGSKSLGNIMIYLSLPCVIINGFLVERTKERMTGLAVSAVAALILLLLSIALTRLFVGKNAIENFAGSFSNPGFFGVPLIIASMGDDAVFYVAAFVAFLCLLQWTYGVSLFQKGGMQGIFVKFVKAPFFVAIVIGMFFFLTGIPVPGTVRKCITSITNSNTSIAMFAMGVYLAQIDIMKMFRKTRLYLVAFVRLVVCPAAALALLSLLPDQMLELKMAVLIVSACPTGSNVTVYAQLYDADYAHAVETVIISTLFSVITIPAFVGIASMIW